MTIISRIGRRVAGATLAGALATGALAAVATPAQAEDVTTSTASLTWGYSGYAHQGVLGPWAFKDATGNAGILAAGTQTEYRVEYQPVTSQPSGKGNYPKAAKFTAGTGSVDSTTGRTDLEWEGSFTVNAYPSLPAGTAAPDEIYADPHLTVAANGSGSLTFDVTIGAGFDMDGEPTPATHLGALTVASFPAGSVTGSIDDGFRLTPAYQGVAVTPPSGDTAQVTTCTAPDVWGSWPAAFVQAMPSSIRPHYYSTGCGGLGNAKPALPVDVEVNPDTPTTTSFTAPKLTYGKGGTLTATVTSPSGTPTGNAVLTGVGSARTAVLSGGTATFTLPTTLSVGSRTIGVQYTGATGVASSTASATLTVVKATVVRPTVKVTKSPTSTKTGKATITVKSTVSGQTPSGKVSIALTKSGKTTKKASGTLKGGKVTLTVPQLAKGTWKLRATYAGSSTHASSTSVNHTVKSTK